MIAGFRGLPLRRQRWWAAAMPLLAVVRLLLTAPVWRAGEQSGLAALAKPGSPACPHAAVGKWGGAVKRTDRTDGTDRTDQVIGLIGKMGLMEI